MIIPTGPPAVKREQKFAQMLDAAQVIVAIMALIFVITAAPRMVVPTIGNNALNPSEIILKGVILFPDL